MQRILAFAFALILQFSILTSSSFAGDSTSFNPVPIAVLAKSGVPVGAIIAWGSTGYPEDYDAARKNWMDCDGRGFSKTTYEDLARLYPSGRIPDYNNQFMRGGTVAQVGQVVADSTRSHAHNIPAHSHTVSGSASSQKVTVGSQSVNGSASGNFIDYHQESGKGPGYRNDGGHLFLIAQYANTPDGLAPIINERGPEGMFGHNTLKTVTSAVTATTSGGTYSTGGGSITGWTNAVAQNSDASGGAETAPQHTRVRYLIRALP